MKQSLLAVRSLSPFAEAVQDASGQFTVFHLYGTDSFTAQGAHSQTRNALFQAQAYKDQSKTQVPLELDLLTEAGVQTHKWTLDVAAVNAPGLTEVLQNLTSAGSEMLLVAEAALPHEALDSPVSADALAQLVHDEPMAWAESALDASNWLPAGGVMDHFYADSGFMPDVFSWSAQDVGVPGQPVISVINDFNVASPQDGGDVLVLSDLLPNSGQGSLGAYLHFEHQDNATVIHVNRDGGFADTQDAVSPVDLAQLRIVLPNIDLTQGQAITNDQIIQELLKVGKLVADGSA